MPSNRLKYRLFLVIALCVLALATFLANYFGELFIQYLIIIVDGLVVIIGLAEIFGLPKKSKKERIELEKLKVDDILTITGAIIEDKIKEKYIPRTFKIRTKEDKIIKSVNLMDSLTENKHIIITGTAGVGKSVEIARLADFTLTKLHNKKEAPIFIDCRPKVAVDFDFGSLIANEFITNLKNAAKVSAKTAVELSKDEGFVNDYILDISNIIFIDGIDGVEPENVDAFSKSIIDYLDLARKRKTNVVIAIRDETFNSLFGEENLRKLISRANILELQPLLNTEISEAVKYYLGKTIADKNIPDFFRIPLMLLIIRDTQKEKLSSMDLSTLLNYSYIDLFNNLLKEKVERHGLFEGLVNLINEEDHKIDTNYFGTTTLMGAVGPEGVKILKNEGIVMGEEYLQFFHDSFHEFLWAKAKLQEMLPTNVKSISDMVERLLSEERLTGAGKIRYIICILEELELPEKLAIKNLHLNLLEELSKESRESQSWKLCIGIIRTLKNPNLALNILGKLMEPHYPKDVRIYATMTMGMVGGRGTEEEYNQARSTLIKYFLDKGIGDVASWALGQLSASRYVDFESEVVHKPLMIVKFSEDLTQQEFLDQNGNTLGVIDNPILLKDNIKMRKLAKSKKILDLWGNPMHIMYGNRKFFWDFKCWPPSIDTLIFIKNVLGSPHLPKKMGFVLDLGCGTGFVGICVASSENTIGQVHFSDIDPLSIEYARLNCRLNNIPSSKTLFFTGNGFENIPKVKYDAVFCVPPYIPPQNMSKEEMVLKLKEDPTMGNFYNWLDTGLLKNAILDGKKYCTRLFTLYPIFLKDKVEKWIEKTGASVIPIGSYEIPMTIPYVIGDEEWLKQLIEKGLKDKMKDGYKYWNTTNIVLLKFENAEV